MCRQRDARERSVCQSPHAQSMPIPTQSTCCRVNTQARITSACCWGNWYRVLQWEGRDVVHTSAACQHPVPAYPSPQRSRLYLVRPVRRWNHPIISTRSYWNSSDCRQTHLQLPIRWGGKNKLLKKWVLCYCKKIQIKRETQSCLHWCNNKKSLYCRLFYCRAPSVSCATRLKLSACLFFFLREYLPNRWTYLNKSLHGDGKWSGIEHGGFHFLIFLRGLRLGAKNVTFCPDLPGVTFTKYNMAPKRRTISKIENCLVLAR